MFKIMSSVLILFTNLYQVLYFMKVLDVEKRQKSLENRQAVGCTQVIN